MADEFSVSGFVGELFQWLPRNESFATPGMYDIEMLDGCFILLVSLIIFTMQTGFALVESGCVSRKNEVNIMMKNVVDCSFGGIR
jgi:hypothetical protein